MVLHVAPAQNAATATLDEAFQSCWGLWKELPAQVDFVSLGAGSADGLSFATARLSAVLPQSGG